MARFRRPSVPTVIALTALVVALAAPAYAAIRFTKADGRRIVKVLPSNGLTGKQIRESRLGRVPRATQADAARNAGRAVNADKAADAAKLGGKAPTDFAPATLLQRVSARLTFGQDVALVTNGPVSLRAQCVASEPPEPVDGAVPVSAVRVYARTTEADSFMAGHHDFDGNPDLLQPNTPIPGPSGASLWRAAQDATKKTPFVVNDAGKGFVAAPSGSVISGDGQQVLLALHAFGADCAVLGRVALDSVG